MCDFAWCHHFFASRLDNLHLPFANVKQHLQKRTFLLSNFGTDNNTTMLVVKVRWDIRNWVTHQKYQFNQGTSLSYPHHFNPSFNLSSFGNVVFLFKVCERIFSFEKHRSNLVLSTLRLICLKNGQKSPLFFLDAPYVWPLFWIIS